MTTKTNRIETLYIDACTDHFNVCVTSNLIAEGEINTNFYTIHNPNVDMQVTSTWTDIPFHLNITNNEDYTHTLGNAEVILNKKGTYDINAFTNITMANGNSRTTTSTKLMIDKGSGYIIMPGSASYSYHRNSSEGDNTLISQSIYKCDVNDKIKLQVRLINTNGTKTLFIVPEECSFKIKRL